MNSIILDALVLASLVATVFIHNQSWSQNRDNWPTALAAGVYGFFVTVQNFGVVTSSFLIGLGTMIIGFYLALQLHAQYTKKEEDNARRDRQRKLQRRVEDFVAGLNTEQREVYIPDAEKWAEEHSLMFTDKTLLLKRYFYEMPYLIPDRGL